MSCDPCVLLYSKGSYTLKDNGQEKTFESAEDVHEYLYKEYEIEAAEISEIVAQATEQGSCEF